MTSHTEARPRAASRNPITGDKLQTKPSTKEYRDGWDRIYTQEDKMKKTLVQQSELKPCPNPNGCFCDGTCLTKKEKENDRKIQESK